MKKVSSIIFIILFMCIFTGCGKESVTYLKFENVDDYSKVFELTDVRFMENAKELFPKDLINLNVNDFLCEWSLVEAENPKVQIFLSVTYDEDGYSEEIRRINSLNGKLINDHKNFDIPAFVSVMGYSNSNWYAVAQKDLLTVNYICLQLINRDEVVFSQDFLPREYSESGNVNGICYNVYEQPEEGKNDIPDAVLWEYLTEKYERLIEGAYIEEAAKPDNCTTYGMSKLRAEYAEKWREVADIYYKKIMEYEGDQEDWVGNPYTDEDLHTFVSALKDAWDQYYLVEYDNYVNVMHYVFDPGTIMGPLSAQHEYDMQKEWAMKLLSIADMLYLYIE